MTRIDVDNMTLADLCSATGGEIGRGIVPAVEPKLENVTGIAADPRAVQPGDVFWNLSENQAEQAVADALGRGARGVVADRGLAASLGAWRLETNDATLALAELIGWNRKRRGAAVWGVSGGTGKTTIGEMVCSVLQQQFRGRFLAAGRGEFPLPLELLSLSPDDEFAVFEPPAAAAGQVAQACRVASPDGGLVAPIGESRWEESPDAPIHLAAAEELLAALGDKQAVLAGDDPRLRRVAASRPGKRFWAGRSLHCDLVATQVRYESGMLRFSVDGFSYRAPVWGRHFLHAALMAVAVGRLWGMPSQRIAQGLESFRPAARRCQVSQLADVTVIDDACNDDPMAVQAALELLRDIDLPGRKIVAWETTRAANPLEETAHRKLGRQLVRLCGADLALVCGANAKAIVAGAMEAGMPRQGALTLADPAESAQELRRRVRAGDAVLIKGFSPSNADQIVRTLADRGGRLAA